MSALPVGVLNIDDDSITLSSEYAKHGKELCEFAMERAKEEKNMEQYSYYRGRVGVFNAILQIFNYRGN